MKYDIKDLWGLTHEQKKLHTQVIVANELNAIASLLERLLDHHTGGKEE